LSIRNGMFVQSLNQTPIITVKKRLLLSTLHLLAAGIMFISCKGEDGAVGPAGAKGDAGVQGTAGAKGDKGDAGTANVIYSEWTAIPLTPSYKDSKEKEYSISAPKITKDVFDKGLVYAYARSGGSATAFLLPYYNTYQAGMTYNCSISISQGWVRYSEIWAGAGAVNSAWINSAKTTYFSHIRYVIIPGGASARVASVDYADYEAVKKYYNLPD
jgi:hypothetical protein